MGKHILTVLESNNFNNIVKNIRYSKKMKHSIEGELNMKLLTISIAAYNVEDYLDEALNSLCCDEKLMDKLEVLIEDDGSTDNTLNIAKEFEDKYPHVFRTVIKENGGYGSTINNSIKLANGKYFKQLDGDDWFNKEYLNGFLDWLSNQNADFIITPYYNCYEENKWELVDNCKKIESKTSEISAMNSCENFGMHELAIKTELLQKHNISITEKCFYTDNEYTFLPLFFAKTVAKYDKPIYCYRLGRDGQSVSLEGVNRHYRDSLVVAKKMYDTYLENKETCITIKPVIEKKLIYITNTVYTYYMVTSGDHKKILRKFDNMLKIEYPDIYKITNSIKKVRLLRQTRFLGYSYVKKILLKRWK